jgi:hypothetical protein
MKTLFAFLAMCALAVPASTQAADDWQISSVHVTAIEATYMPTAVLFTVDANAGSCGAGNWLKWSGIDADQETAQANNKAVYALLLASKLSGSTVRLFGSNSGCLVKFIYSA